MGWRDLLQTSENEEIVAPWVGGRSLYTFNGTWQIDGRLPPEHGWHRFKTSARKASWVESTDMPMGVLKQQVKGYLVGDFLVPDNVKIVPQIKDLPAQFERVFLIEPGLDRFVRVTAGRFSDEGQLFYDGLDMPLGPEESVLTAFLDQKDSVNDVPGVVPALDAAFSIETWRRKEAERIRREEEEKRLREEKRRKLMETLGDGAGRREVAMQDFAAAARAALAVGGAQYLDHRTAANRNEVVVRFRLDRQRFECVCNKNTMRIVDAGICLVDHATGERGDTFFTLESLPAVIRQAQRERRLVVFRHVD